MNVFGHEDEIEPVRNADGADHLKRGSARGQVANSAIDRAAAELDGSGFQDSVAGRNAVLVGCDHVVTLAQKPL
jgi:hypothetical protein